MGSCGAGLSLAGGGFDRHFLAEIAFLEGLQNGLGDAFDLLEPVGAVLLRCWCGIGGADFSGEGGCGSGGEGAEEEAAAIWG